jgi:hypothetical protein
MGMSIWYTDFPSINSPKDGRCDKCGLPAVWVITKEKFSGIEIESQNIHEYCEFHAMIYTFFNPLIALPMIITHYITSNNQYVGSIGYSLFLGILTWLYVIGLIIIASKY